MFCGKCGKENPDGAVYCGACGVKLKAVPAQSVVVKGNVKNRGKKRSFWRWVLWWEVDREDLKRQVENYDSLKLTSSYRGIAALWLVLSIVVMLVIFGWGDYDYSIFLDIGILTVLAFFVYFGHRWAMVCAMIYWTFAKIVALIDEPPTLVMQVVWWIAYMSALFRAWEVEKERRTL